MLKRRWKFADSANDEFRMEFAVCNDFEVYSPVCIAVSIGVLLTMIHLPSNCLCVLQVAYQLFFIRTAFVVIYSCISLEALTLNFPY